METKNIKSIKDLYKDSLPDRILTRNLVLFVEINYVPENDLNGESIIIKDETDKLEATTNSNLFVFLKEAAFTKKKIMIRGYLTKTEFENLSFGIEEILDK